jgi:undecaprenyl-diphosphatase
MSVIGNKYYGNMLESLNQIDTSLFLFINGNHTSFWDVIMWWASDKFIWTPLYTMVLWLLIKQNPGHVALLFLVIVLLVLISDQSANLAKFVLIRPRPSHEPALQGMVHMLYNYTGGSYSFYSAHASSSFAVAVFVISLIGRKMKWIIPVVLIYAFLVSYSRIYLGVHYPGDVITGALIGSIIGYTISRSYLKYCGWKDKRMKVHNS